MNSTAIENMIGALLSDMVNIVTGTFLTFPTERHFFVEYEI